MEPTNPIALLRQLEWGVKHAAENVIGGDYRSSFRGRGMEFDQVVKYEYGDDFRDIDWNVTARLGEPYRKKFIEERGVTIVLLFEDSISLQFGSESKSKRQALMEMASLLGLLAAANRDRFGVFYYSQQRTWFREPSVKRGEILHSCASLLSQKEPVYSDRDRIASIPWKILLKAAPRHTLLLWLGDFSHQMIPEGWATLRRHFQTVGFRVDDPWEREFPDTEQAALYDPLQGRMVLLDPASSHQRQAHQSWMGTRDIFWKQLFPGPLSRMTFITNQNLLDALMSFFRIRMLKKA